jgi:hypothetical protein
VLKAIPVAVQNFSDVLRGEISEERFVLVVASTQYISPATLEAMKKQESVLVLGKNQLRKTYGATMQCMCAPRTLRDTPSKALTHRCMLQLLRKP